MARPPKDRAFEWHCSKCNATGRYTTKRPMAAGWCTSCGAKLRPQDEKEIPYGSAPGAGMRPQ